VIRVTRYGVIAEKRYVGKLDQIFPCTLYQKLYVGSKMNGTFLMGTTSSITVQSLEKIAQCAPAVGAKMWCLFCLFVFFCHAPSPEHRAFEGCIVRTYIALPFIARFRRGFEHFFRRDCSFRCTFHKRFLFQTRYIVLIFVARWRHYFHELEKIAKIQKIGAKVCAHHFV